MGNPNKAKGDRAEVAVRDLVTEWFPESWRTRAGWDDDRGDIVLDLLGDKSTTVALQVKDTSARPGTPEFRELAAQIKAGQSRWGVIWWKLRGKGDPREWSVMMTGDQFLVIMNHIRNLHFQLDGVDIRGDDL